MMLRLPSILGGRSAIGIPSTIETCLFDLKISPPEHVNRFALLWYRIRYTKILIASGASLNVAALEQALRDHRARSVSCRN
jgi:hypothetical protein